MSNAVLPVTRRSSLRCIELVLLTGSLEPERVFLVRRLLRDSQRVRDLLPRGPRRARGIDVQTFEAVGDRAEGGDRPKADDRVLRCDVVGDRGGDPTAGHGVKIT